jgi:DNA-binding response OmpR family regulator
MGSAVTIVLAREDLSIPGAPMSAGAPPDHADAVKRRFFSLIEASKPDVIVLDFSAAPRSGADTVMTVRRRSAVPILVVCNPAHAWAKEYRSAGAVDCVSAPVDPLCLSQAVRRILRGVGNSRAQAMRRPAIFSFAGLSFQTERNRLVADEGASLILTNSEGRLLAHFLSQPWTLCSQTEIRELLLNGHDNAVGSRAPGAIVNRLRRKLLRLAGFPAQSLIKTKIRRGYWLAADVTTPPQKVSTQPW